MARKSRFIGDNHVKMVHEGLLTTLNGLTLNTYPKKVIKTVKFITELFPNIIDAKSKFDYKNTNESKDLVLYLNDHSVVTVNLFLIQKGARIQQKNLGAKSFLLKYFLSEQLQDQFNQKLDQEYRNFLFNLVSQRKTTYFKSSIRELRKEVTTLFPKFTEEINIYREDFLYSLREMCFNLLRDSYNVKNEGFLNAYKSLFMTEDTNIITSYSQNDHNIMVEEFNLSEKDFKNISIYKVGKNTVGIKYDNIALTLRFKFESNPNSSIKLAASYVDFHERQSIESINNVTIKKMQSLLENHDHKANKNSSNAIGKCHEALTYFYFIKDSPEIAQVEVDECVHLLSKYYHLVKPNVLASIVKSTSTIIPVITNKLKQKYTNIKVESVELVPESYIENRLDTGDLKLILKSEDKYMTESISLKAISKTGRMITTKNPGIGSILGPTYFNIGNMDKMVTQVKEKFLEGDVGHNDSLKLINSSLGEKLQDATQMELKTGIQNLLGEAIMAITFYEQNFSICKEHSEVKEPISVYTKTPTSIQNQLSWNNDMEKINLRVKFSKAQKYGWSSIKLTSEYRLNLL